MLHIPKELYNREITSYIRNLVLDDNAKDFYSLDELDQDHLVALALKYLDCEVVLSSDANHHLSKYLMSYDRDDEIELRDAIKASAIEQFGAYFDEMITDELGNQHDENMREAGKRPYQDRTNGEIIWL